jgi:hypothetical protein
MNPQDALSDRYDVARNKLDRLKVFYQELETVRNELHLTIKALEEILGAGFPKSSAP